MTTNMRATGVQMLLGALLMATIPAVADAKPAKVFPTPEAAAQGMIDALSADSRAAI